MFQPLTLFFLFLSIVVIDHLPVANSTLRNLLTTQWCVVAISATDAQMQANIDWGCSIEAKVNCRPIQPGGACFDPNTLMNHASFVMNAYYQSHNRTEEACYFNDTGTFIITDPSYGDCVYVS